MHINIYHDWHAYDYGCQVSPGKKELIEVRIETLDSNISISEIAENKLFLVELWGGDGPSMNSFDITDDKNQAFESFKEYLELCSDQMCDENEINTEKILIDAKEKLKI